MQMDFACPMCKYPLGSGGKRVRTRPLCVLLIRSASIISSRKLRGEPSSTLSLFAFSVILPGIVTEFQND